MPKPIPELRNRLLVAAKKRMLADPPEPLTIRLVAADCGTAVGTVYNYFPSKEMLMACVMLEDWNARCVQMQDAAENAPDALTGLSAIFSALHGFSAQYAHTWLNYADRVHAGDQFQSRHFQLISQIALPIESLLRRFHRLIGDHAPTILAEMLLSACRRGDAFETMEPILNKILS